MFKKKKKFSMTKEISRKRILKRAYMAHKKQSEHEAISAFLGLLSSATRYSLLIVNYNFIYLSLFDISLIIYDSHRLQLHTISKPFSACFNEGTNFRKKVKPLANS